MNQEFETADWLRVKFLESAWQHHKANFEKFIKEHKTSDSTGLHDYVTVVVPSIEFDLENRKII